MVAVHAYYLRILDKVDCAGRGEAEDAEACSTHATAQARRGARPCGACPGPCPASGSPPMSMWVAASVLAHMPTNLPSPDVDPLEPPPHLRCTLCTAVEAAFARATMEVTTVPPMPRWREQS